MTAREATTIATITTITYNGLATSITATALLTAGLAASNIAGAEGASITNATNKYVDASVAVNIVYSANVPHGFIMLGITMSVDGANWGSPATGSDAALTLKQVPMFPNNFQPGPGGSLMFPASSIAYATQHDITGWATTPTVRLHIISVAACLGAPNVLPDLWSIFGQNRTDNAFGTTWTANYTGITYTNT